MDRRTLAAAGLLLWWAAAPCTHAADSLTLLQALALAQKPEIQGDVARARYAYEQASGAVRRAESAFQWSAGASAGVIRVYQPGISGGFLTSDTQRFDVPTTTVYAERQFENGIKLRPGYLVAQDQQSFRPDIARLNNRPLLEMEIPLDRRFGESPDALRLSAARSEMSAASTGRGLARQAYLHAVVASVWRVLAAQRRTSIGRALAGQIGSVAQRVTRLAASGEVAAAAAAELRARASLAEALAERGGIELLSSRMELARLLAVPLEALPPIEAEFPDASGAAALDARELNALVEEALARRPDLKAQSERVAAARLRGRIRERDAESKLSLSVGQDRLMLNWSTPIGDTRGSGARQESLAELGAAEVALEDSRQRVRAETHVAFERLATAQRTVPRTAAAAQSLRESVALVGAAVDKGRQAPGAMADVAEQFASASRQSLDTRLMYALALADLRLATGAIPEEVADPEALARLFVTLR